MPKNTRRKPAYLDAKLSVDARVRDLLGRMTVGEKIREMVSSSARMFLKNRRVSVKAVREFFGRMSIGSLQDPRLDPVENVRAVNTIQKYLVEDTRLGIPTIFHSECLHGHMSGGATVFPQAIGLASTWNPDLIRDMARSAAREARAVGVTQSLSPDLDLAREPRWGRCEETYGEDPYLVSRMAVAYVRGMQGDGTRVNGEHLVCTPKHYAAHGSPEGGINISPVSGGMRELRTLYLPPFKAAVTEAGARSVMPCYSEFDGIPAHASGLLLTRILREEWGFQGYTFSDYGGVSMLYRVHKTAHTLSEAAMQALEAGVDLEACGDICYGRLEKLVKNGEVPLEWVDRAAARVLRVKFLAGLFENPFADEKTAVKIVNCGAHRKLARQVAEESIILLRNEGLLPLDPCLPSIAVIGPNAHVTQFGDYAFPKEGAATPLQAIRRSVSRRTQVNSAQGCALYGMARDGIPEAVEAAEKSEVAIVFIGGTSTVLAGIGWGTDRRPATCGEGFDRSGLTLPGVQADLVRAVHATGTPTAVIMIHGRAYSIPWMAQNIPAIVESWYPGEEGAGAIAKVLFGKANPSGKLPVSVPRSVGHVPVHYNHKPSARGCYHQPGTPEKPGRDYVFSSPTPLFAFGHGLSYTTFKYSNLRIAPTRILPGGNVRVSINLRNSGKRKGKEVVQLYLNDLVSSVTTPVKVLRGFKKVDLDPGELRTVKFDLGPEDLMLLDRNMNWIVEPGEFEVMIGGLKRTFSVERA